MHSHCSTNPCLMSQGCKAKSQRHCASSPVKLTAYTCTHLSYSHNKKYKAAIMRDRVYFHLAFVSFIIKDIQCGKNQ